jgi:hypothetical protein
MRRVAALVGAALLAALAAPELPRYSAERRVGWATAAFKQLLESSPSQGGDTLRQVQAVGELALSTTTALPGDPRPWMIGASSFLVTGQPQRALDFYRAALGTGERSEIDLNLGRAYAGLNRRDAARRAPREDRGPRRGPARRPSRGPSPASVGLSRRSAVGRPSFERLPTTDYRLPPTGSPGRSRSSRSPRRGA